MSRACRPAAIAAAVFGVLTLAVTVGGAGPAVAAGDSSGSSGPMSHNGGLPVLAASLALLVAIGIGGWVFSALSRRSGRGRK